MPPSEVPKHVQNKQTVSTLIIGTNSNRLASIAESVGDISEDVEVYMVGKTNEAIEVDARFGLILLTDSEPDTLHALDEIVNESSKSVLSFACLPVDEVQGNARELLNHVDDILLHPGELALRLPFLETRLLKRETSELQNRAILETIVDGIITIDSRGIINTFNPSAERIFGYSANEIVGQPITVLMPEPFRSNHPGYMRRYEETGEARIIGIGREVVGLRKNGDQFPMDLAVSQVDVDSQKFYTGVVRDITVRRQLEHEILRISDQERRRIGQDIHDGLGQMLTGIGLIARSLVPRLEQEGSAHAADMQEVVDLIREADRNARTIARGLVPVELDEQGLEHALTTLVVQVEKLLGCTCSFEQRGAVPALEMSAMTNLYRIAQEAVSNAVKHGKANHVQVELESDPEKLSLTITDDGVGLPGNYTRDQGMGIPIMKYRARAIGANLEIQANEIPGTVVTCLLSLE